MLTIQNAAACHFDVDVWIQSFKFLLKIVLIDMWQLSGTCTEYECIIAILCVLQTASISQLYFNLYFFRSNLFV